MSAVELGQAVRGRMRDLGLSYRDLAERAGIGLGYANSLGRGRVRDPSPHVLRRVAAALEVGYGYLMRLAGYLP